jgi:hypothetical protein
MTYQLLSAKADSLLRTGRTLSALGWLTAAQHRPSQLERHDWRGLRQQQNWRCAETCIFGNERDECSTDWRD